MLINYLVAMISEFFGTLFLILLGNGVVANVCLRKTKGENSGWIVISAGWGFAVFVGVLLSTFSGAHINPAVTIALWVAGIKSAFVGGTFWAVPYYLIAQLLGAMAGAFLVYLCYKPHYDETIDSRNILLTFATVPEIERKSWNFITEMVASFVLVFSVFALGGIALLTSKQVLNDPSFESVVSAVVNNRFLISFVVGIVVFGIGLSLGGPTGYAINPARDLGPRIVHSLLPISQKGSSRWSYAWIPIVAPITGGILAAGLFRLLFLLATNFQL